MNRCPECGSTDVELVDPETAYCNNCEFEGRAGAFEGTQRCRFCGHKRHEHDYHDVPRCRACEQGQIHEFEEPE